MLRRVPLLLLLSISGMPAGADQLPPTSIRYRITVRIDPATRRLAGEEILTWVNRSGRTLDRVPLHLYLNAFAHLGTTWMKEAEVYFAGWLDHDRFLGRYPDPWGWNEPGSIKQLVAGTRHEASWRPIQPDDGNSLDRTLIEVRLPRPVPPGETLTLRVSFAGRLPVPIARTGCKPDFCLVAQWFPKIAALDPKRHERFAARQFHAPTEFFADFADYEVTIEAPRGWTVGATGKRTASSARGAWQTVRHTQQAVHDFAIALGRELHDARARHRPPGAEARPVEVRYLLPRDLAHQVPRARRAVERTLDLFARRVGPYPYETLTVVMPPWSARQTAGMEYPTLITGSPADPLWDRFPARHFRALEFTLVHELGHQYFYGLLASNEQQEAFLDEGFNSHWDGRAMQALFGERASAGWALGRPVDAVELYSHAMARARQRVMEPMRRRPAALFYPGSQRDQIYGRGALTLWTAARRFGVPTLDRIFAAYFKRYRFQHPDAEAFLGTARESGGASIAAFLDEAFSREHVPDYRVVTLTSEEHLPPLGRVVDGEGTITVTRKDREQLTSRFVDRHVRDADGKVWVQIADPGWTRGGGRVDGTVRWVGFERRGAAGAPPKRYYESRARIVGPAWDHLPVTVLLRFDDGAELRERWDGRAAWRGYRIVRGARLDEVRLDESRRVALDVVPENNALRRTPDHRLVADWSGWLAALASWIAGGLSLWL